MIESECENENLSILILEEGGAELSGLFSRCSLGHPAGQY